MIGTLVNARLAQKRPDILISPAIASYRAMDFLKAAEIIRAADPVKDVVKRALHDVLEAA